jgi:hypothetical protein
MVLKYVYFSTLSSNTIGIINLKLISRHCLEKNAYEME